MHIIRAELRTQTAAHAVAQALRLKLIT